MNDKEVNHILARLSRSKFRSSFKLNRWDVEYIDRMGLEKLESHARDFVSARIAVSRPRNDGRQTPFRGHPVFKAQHATATCCRGCIRKWYRIPEGRDLSEGEIELIINIINAWIIKRYGNKV